MHTQQLMMVVKVYTTSQTGSSEIRKNQQHVLNVLQSFKIEYEEIDIADPVQVKEKEFMWEHAQAKKPEKGKPLPPQVFNDEEYCGDHEKFEQFLEDDKLYVFLKMAKEVEVSQAAVTITGGGSD